MHNAKGYHGMLGGQSAALTPTVSVLALAIGVAGQQQLQAQATSIDPGNAVDAAASALSGDLTASKVIQDPGAPYENLFQNFDLGLGAKPKVGPSNARLGFGPFNLSEGVGTPIARGFQPDSAELKIGNFYLDILSLTGSLLYTDNRALSDTNRDDDLASAVSLQVRALYQLNEGLRVAVQGSLIWLPLDGRAGIDGFGISDPYARLGLDDGQLFSAFVASDFTLGKWDITVYDQFRIVNRTLYGLGESGVLDLYDGEDFDGSENFRGRRLLSSQNNTGGTYRDRTRNSSDFEAEALDYINTAGVTAQRMLPTDTEATIGYYHQNYWYSSASKSLRTGAGIKTYNYKDTFYAQLDSRRENLRFKPYAYYRTFKNDIETGWNQAVGGGLLGPITDQLDFQGEAGYTFSGSGKRDTETWGVALLHDAGPFTKHKIQYRRQLTDPEELIEQSLTYSLRQVLGPYLTGYVFARHSTYEDTNTPINDSEEQVYGAGVQFDLDQYGQMQFLGLHRIHRFDNPGSSNFNTWTFRFIYDFPVGETVSASIFYQFETRDSAAAGSNYYENLGGLRVTKKF